MEAKRQAVIGLHIAGKRPVDIVRELSELGVTKLFVLRTIKRFSETGSIATRHGENRKRTATSKEMVRKVRLRLKRNPRQSARAMARDLKISVRSLCRILKDDLHVRPYKIQKVHFLSELQMKVRLERAKELKRRIAAQELPNIVFSDENFFTVEQSVNKQNDRVWLRNKKGANSDLLQATRRQGAASVMVWGGITADGRTPLVFIPEGVKVNGPVYRELVLEGALKPWIRKHFNTRPFTFQQDSAPSHTARETQEWLRVNTPGFITSKEWPPYSPDLNPMDFSIWGILEAKVSATRYTTVEGLKAALLREWKRIPLTVLRSSCDAFVGRLTQVTKAKGGHIEV